MNDQHTFVDDSDEADYEEGLEEIVNDTDGEEVSPEEARKILSAMSVDNKTGEIRVAGDKKDKSEKTIMTKLNRSNGMYLIYFKEGGQLPPELTGHFTSLSEVDSAVSAYRVRRDVEAQTA